MSRNQIEQAAADYLDGSLSPHDRSVFEGLMEADPELRRFVEAFIQLDRFLGSQEWIVPRAGFVQAVMARVEEAGAVASSRQFAAEQAAFVAPLAAFGLSVLFYGRVLLGWIVELGRSIAGWLDAQTGLTLFASHPATLLGVVAPVLSIAVASCIMSGRCRLTS